MHRWPTGTPLSKEPTFTWGSYRTHDGAGAKQWKDVHTASNTYVWTNLDPVIDYHWQRGVDIMYTVYGCPTWAADPSNLGHTDAYGTNGGAGRPANMSDLGNFITQLVTRYNSASGIYGSAASRIKTIEVWNEPKFDGLFTGFWWDSAADMALMAKTIKDAAKAVDPAIKIAGPGFASIGSNIASFLNAADGTGTFGRDHIDQFGIHAYSTLAPRMPGGAGASQFTAVLATARANMVAGGLAADYPLHDTEHGFLTTAGDWWLAQNMTTKAAWLRRIAAIEAANGIKSLYWYSYGSDAPPGGPMGWPDPQHTVQIQRAYDDINTFLAGKTITKIDQRNDGSMDITAGGITFNW